MEIAKAQIESKEALAGFQQTMSTLNDDLMMVRSAWGFEFRRSND